MISFGPVQSRRLGMSLGINNIVAPKVCSFNCIYCQVGKTKITSIKRDTFYDPEIIFREVSEHLRRISKENYPDYLTFVSNGEPTLDKNLGKSIALLKRTGIPVAVISNASLLFDESVRDDLALADWVSLKIDASDDKTWQMINRPYPELDFSNHLKYFRSFAAEYTGNLNIETMIIKRVNDTLNNLSALSVIIKEIDPDTAYLSVPTRPPAEKRVQPPDIEKLNLAWHIFTTNKIKTEFLTGFEGTGTGYTGNIYEDILNITAVHPLREDTLNELLKKDNADINIVESLVRQKLIKSTIYKGKRFYTREYH